MPYRFNACPRCDGTLARDTRFTEAEEPWSCLSCAWVQPPDQLLPRLDADQEAHQGIMPASKRRGARWTR